ncbi:tetratricopeptide repeat protein [Puteibacter caeruleilacunae]|nr:tetratricopeptide repeat protein [Puteibacter caeruleilacunae]
MQKYLSITLLILLAGFAKAQQTPSEEIIEKGIKLHDEGKYAEAIQAYNLVHENDSNYYRMLAEIALSYLDMGKNDSAIHYTQVGLSTPNAHHLNLYVTQGTAYDHLGEQDKAIEVYKKALKKYPSASLLYFNLGITLSNKQAYKEAEKCFQNALICNPYHASSHYALGKINARQKQYTKAFLALETFLAIEPASGRSNKILVYLENLANNYVDTTQGNFIEPFSENAQFEEIDHYIRAKVPLSKRYPSKANFNASLVKQTQMLLEVLPFDDTDNNFYSKMYFPFFKAIKDGGHFEPFIFSIIRSANNEKISDYLENNQELVKKFFATGTELSDIRIKRVFNFEGEEKIYNCGYYKGGSLFSIGNSNEEGKEQGLWHYFHANGELNAKGKFIDGKKEGEWVYYNSKGQIETREFNVNGELNGVLTSYRSNGSKSYELPYKDSKGEGHIVWYDIFGKKTGEGNFSNDKRVGESKNYYVSGKTKDDFSYKDGELDGEYISYHANGQISDKSVYTNGKQEGENIGYYINGELSYKGNYKEGELDGEWNYYHPNGNLKQHCVYKAGKVVGEHKTYNHHGKVEKISMYNDKGNFHGVCKSYDLNGIMHLEEEYINDTIIRVTSFNKNGEPIKTFENKEGTFDFITYTADGLKLGSGSFVSGKNNGEWKIYHRNGTVSKLIHYEKGILNGEYKMFYPSGQLKEIANYKEGQIEGYSIDYHENGQKETEGYLIAGAPDGHWYYYNQDGSLDAYYHFKEGAASGWATRYAPDGKIENKVQYLEGKIVQRCDYNQLGEVINTSDFSKQAKCQVKSTSDIVVAEYHINRGIYEGDYIWYHPNGKISTKRTFIDDDAHGKNDKYYANGQQKSQGNVIEGNDFGKWEYWYEDGTKQSERFYYNDKRDSTCIFYYENGKISRKENYYIGMYQGNTTLYDPNGELIICLIYDNDELMAYQYNKNGQLCDPIKIASADQEIVAYFDNGKLSYKQQRKNSVPEGVTAIYKSDGTPLEKMVYHYGLLDGEKEEYYPNGKMKLKTNYSNGMKEGEQKEYWNSGKLKTVSQYMKDDENGKKKIYNESGKLIRIENYWADNFVGFDQLNN